MALPFSERMWLWFDVESKYEATHGILMCIYSLLWFDVESKYEATVAEIQKKAAALWFDVESKYEATLNAMGTSVP